MPARRGPGRPRGRGRPRKIEEDYILASEGYAVPSTRQEASRVLRRWGDFLRARAVSSEAVRIQDLIAFERELGEDGFTAGDHHAVSMVRSYYLSLARQDPDSRWAELAGKIRGHRLPRVVGARRPHKPFPLRMLPQLLEASRHVLQRSPKTGAEIYSEAYALTATLLYSGMRAQVYGLRDSQVELALQERKLQVFVKEGEEVFVPIPDQLLRIWRDHLDYRDFEGPQFFRNGRNPYTYQEGNRDWREDALALGGNDKRVQDILHGRGEDGADSVEREFRILYGLDERVTAHRFRKSVGTYMTAYGFTEPEVRLQLSHGARTITQAYSLAQADELQKKLSQIDLGNAEWVAAHDPPVNLFAGKGQDEDLVDQLRAQLQEERDRSTRLERKLDAVLERLEARVIA